MAERGVSFSKENLRGVRYLPKCLHIYSTLGQHLENRFGSSRTLSASSFSVSRVANYEQRRFQRLQWRVNEDSGRISIGPERIPFPPWLLSRCYNSKGLWFLCRLQYIFPSRRRKPRVRLVPVLAYLSRFVSLSLRCDESLSPHVVCPHLWPDHGADGV